MRGAYTFGALISSPKCVYRRLAREKHADKCTPITHRLAAVQARGGGGDVWSRGQGTCSRGEGREGGRVPRLTTGPRITAFHSFVRGRHGETTHRRQCNALHPVVPRSYTRTRKSHAPQRKIRLHPHHPLRSTFLNGSSIQRVIWISVHQHSHRRCRHVLRRRLHDDDRRVLRRRVQREIRQRPRDTRVRQPSAGS